MRAFIAIEIPENISKFLESLQKQFEFEEKIKFTKKPFHLTLKFLGDITEKQVTETKKILGQIKVNPFELQLTSLGVFPNENYIKVIWLGLEGEKISELQQEIDLKLNKVFKKDTRFHPHITLARVKFVKDKEKIKKLLKMEIPKLRFEVKSFKLIKSELTSEGPRYEDLETYNF